MRRVVVAALVALTLACAGARKAQRPTPEQLPEVPSGLSTLQLLSEAHAAFAQRPDPEAVRRAEAFFEAAAQQDPQNVEALYGAIEAKLWRVDRAADASERDALAGSAVESGRQCVARAPDAAACHYGLALALGIEGRERHSVALSNLQQMIAELRRAEELDPRFEQAGPARVLGVVSVRAPGWPVGPGDAETGLEEARKAVDLFAEYPPNLLALSEALLANGAAEESRQWAERALGLAQAQQQQGDPDAPSWVTEAEQLIAGKRGGT